MISQGSSEHSICFAVPRRRPASARARRCERAFARELRDGQIQTRRRRRRTAASSPWSATAWPARPASPPTSSARSARAGVNVRAIAQGASERNISVVIDERRRDARAARGARAASTCRRTRSRSALIGPGMVGSVLLDQLASQARAAARDFNLDLRVRGDHDVAAACCSRISGSASTAGASARGRAASRWTSTRSRDHVHADHLPHAVIIDCTASDDGGARTTPRWLGDGIHVVTPNKQRQQRAARAAIARSARGAPRRRRALPLRGHGRRRPADHPDAARPARDRRRDPQIEGISRARSRICSTSGTAREPFSAVRARRARRRATPSPTRATTCRAWTSRASWSSSAREMGLQLELERRRAREPRARRRCVGVRRRGVPRARCDELDAPMLARLRAARARGRVLRYVGRARRRERPGHRRPRRARARRTRSPTST